MRVRMKAHRGLTAVLGLVGLTAIIVSILTDCSEHNYALLIGLGLTTIVNLMNALSNRERQKQ